MRYFRSFLKNRKLIYSFFAVAVFIVISYFLFFRSNYQDQIIKVGRSEFVQTVAVSGSVTASQNLNLAFEQSGLVKKVYVLVGDIVSAGTLLVAQDVSQLLAQTSEMQAGVNVQKAKLDQLLAGALPEDITIKRDAVSLASKNLSNGYEDALAQLNASYSSIYDAQAIAHRIQNTYFTLYDQHGLKVREASSSIANQTLEVKLLLDAMSGSHDNIDDAIVSVISTLQKTFSNLRIIRDQTDEGSYYASVNSTDKGLLDTQRSNINNTLISLLASKQNIYSQKSALQQAENELKSISAPPRNTDVAVQRAEIAKAEAVLEGVYAQIKNKQIFSPIDGVITKIDANLGSTALAGSSAISLINKGAFQIESYVPEIYAPLVKIGNEAKITLDAYGSDKFFSAKVISIDLAQTTKDGVPTYKTILELQENSLLVKSGMTANVVIVTEKKNNVIAIPQGAVRNIEGSKVVIIKDGDSTIEREVFTGAFSSSGNVEIVSGLNEGDIVIIR
jgi:HlyD family secretion protein